MFYKFFLIGSRWPVGGVSRRVGRWCRREFVCPRRDLSEENNATGEARGWSDTKQGNGNARDENE